MNQMTEWAKKAREGDPHAFARLYEGIYKEMYRFALYTLRNPADAEDAVSEAVMDAFASIGSLRREEAFKAWMFRILSNKCKNKMREYVRKNVDWEDVEDDLPYVQEMEENYYLRKIFRELEDEERLIVSLHVFGGYTSREIAGLLSMNANTVRTKENRALKKLAAKLAIG